MPGLNSSCNPLCLSEGSLAGQAYHPLLLPQAAMKKEKSHGRDEADCRAELILFDGDCTDPTKDTAALLLEASGKPGAPGEWDWGGCAAGVAMCPSFGVLELWPPDSGS